MGVAPNGVIAYVRKLYLSSISDNAIVQQSGLLNHLTGVDLVRADKCFLIQDLVPNGASVNIPPFLNKGTFTEREARADTIFQLCASLGNLQFPLIKEGCEGYESELNTYN